MNEHGPNTPKANAPTAGWGDLLSGKNLIRSLALSGGVSLHALNLYISTTILPSIVAEIGGLEYYAWNTTLFVVASILGAALSSRLLAYAGARAGYAVAALVFAIGALICATAPAMAAMLIGRFVQGLGGGLMLALPYAMIRRIFAETLWPRALALLSSMWGAATLLGPAVGGIFAEFGIWRAAFWSLIPATTLFTVAAWFVLPREAGEQDRDTSPPLLQLGLLTIAVLAASWGSVGEDVLRTAVGLVIAAALVGVLVAVELQSPNRLLPKGVFSSASPLGRLYAISALLAVTVTCTEIFLPLFLQELHGRSPLEAGYIAAVMSAGWTIGAVVTSGLRENYRAWALRAGPLLSLATTLTLAALMPWSHGMSEWTFLTLNCIVLLAGGFAVGIAYPHLSARVLQLAPANEGDSAAAAIMTVQLCATAFGAALAGLTVNLAGRGFTPGELDFASAARWLFAVVAVAPALSILMMRSSYFQPTASEG